MGNVRYFSLMVACAFVLCCPGFGTGALEGVKIEGGRQEVSIQSTRFRLGHRYLTHVAFPLDAAGHGLVFVMQEPGEEIGDRYYCSVFSYTPDSAAPLMVEVQGRLHAEVVLFKAPIIARKGPRFYWISNAFFDPEQPYGEEECTLDVSRFVLRSGRLCYEARREMPMSRVLRDVRRGKAVVLETHKAGMIF